ncbi:MAG TPA: hypothetical protein VFA67_16625 [Candidatus Sulfotelmatobacter sp.]|nr:hypothetical protein [Candidatus Sulfotelmatobacter sp.]
MWKKLENFAGSRPDLNSNQAPNSNETPEQRAESEDDAWLMDTIKGEDRELAEREFEPGRQADTAPPSTETGEARPEVEQAPPVTLGAYTEAVTKFTRSASAFIEHLPLLAEARKAYEEATRASTELRRVLDSGDENLRTLMTHLEQMANIHLVHVPVVRSISEKRPAEPSRLGPVRAGEEGKGGIKRFP